MVAAFAPLQERRSTGVRATVAMAAAVAKAKAEVAEVGPT
jgi:hypothetical protein